jgi:hypothetical protein
VLIGDNLPKLGTNLVAALATLDVNNLSHLQIKWEGKKGTVSETYTLSSIVSMGKVPLDALQGDFQETTVFFWTKQTTQFPDLTRR